MYTADRATRNVLGVTFKSLYTRAYTHTCIVQYNNNILESMVFTKKKKKR